MKVMLNNEDIKMKVVPYKKNIEIGYKELKDKKDTPVKIIFNLLKEVRSKKNEATPIEELFEYAMNALNLEFKEASFNLDRESGTGSKHDNDLSSVIHKAYDDKVEYIKMISEDVLLFDGLDTGEIKLDDVIKQVKTSKPVRETLNIELKYLSMTLIEGYDRWQRFRNENLSIEGDYYPRELTIKVNMPWLSKPMSKHKLQPVIKINLKNKGYGTRTSVEMVKDILDEYISSMKA